MNPLEKAINEIVADIEKKLLKGQISSNTPQLALDYHTKLSAYLSTCHGMIERLDTLEAQYFVDNRNDSTSDLAVKKNWKVSKEGIRQTFWENRIKRLKVLLDCVMPLYYEGRDEKRLKELK